ncbi:glycosyl hydrolase family 18 protein [Thermococcus sp. ES12]|uniref:glycosyl hydrolase family 18 protein n=1 Tax=Thermococcus sp. ES12 TaxID=1638246 RepID=UPI00143105E1|nr:glycosyl hydrolase family 18 protein [Thermococcus sp. ES12]NJE76965.1 hypothetical protein [Thermococcus sp. ES12]
MNKRRISAAVILAIIMLSAVPSLPFFGFVSASHIQLSGRAIAWDIVNLTWTPADNVKEYEIYRSTNPLNLISPNNLLVVINWSTYPPYEPGETYQQGDVVEYDGKIWRAKYWTQNAPGGEAWELIGDVTPATSYLDRYGLKANTTYFYAVVPVLKDGSRGIPSGVLQVKTPYEPYRVIVYYISWGRYARKFYVSDIPWDKVTHLNYAFLDLKEDGTVTYYDTYADPLNLEELKEYKEKYPAVKVLVSVGGWTLSKYFSPVAADPAKRQRFAESVLEIIRKYHLDGVDIDWEYPGGGGLDSNYASPDDGKNFVLLLKTIREVFDQAEKADHRDYLITAAVPADPVKASRINWTEASRYLDSINVMTYDYHGAWESITGHNAPLYADPNAPYTDPNVKWNFNVNASVQWYINHVPDRTKVVLGLPFYGRSFSNVPSTNNGLYQSFSGTPDGTWGPASETYGVMDYWDIVNKIASGEYQRYWDPVAMVPYAYSPTKKVFISYDDPESIGIKVDYALKNGIGGVMVWEITADRKPGTSDHPLLDTILDHLKERPPAWLPDTYYISSSVSANLTVPEPIYNETSPSPGNGTTSGQENQTDSGQGSTYGNGTNVSDVLRPDTISVTITDWGDTEYDVTLNLNGTYDWELWVMLRNGSVVKSLWSANKAEENGWIVFMPVSWNRGPTASFGFIASGSKPVEEMVLKVNGQVWDLWPEGVNIPQDNSTIPGGSQNTTPSNSTESSNNNANSTELTKPDSISVQVTDWGDTEYDVTLNLNGTYDWKIKVKLVQGSSISSFWGVSKSEEDEWIVFMPVSWNRGPTASFGFIATGSEPVEQMVLEVNSQTWDVWPKGSSVPQNQSDTTGDGSSEDQTSESGSQNTTAPSNTTYVPAEPGLPEHFFAPYVDMSLTSVHRPLVEYYNLTGTPYFTLAFILYGSAYDGPSWGGSLELEHYVDEVRELRKAGGDVIIAFGGAVGPYLCQQAKSAEQLAEWYLQVIDTYNVTYLDFDIESSIDANLLADALLIVQREIPWVKFSFTLPSDPGAGLVGNGYSIIQTMVEKGVEIDRVNPMTMDYYWTPSNADNAISVAEHVFSQLNGLYPEKEDNEIWGVIGLTPMIGVNDDHSVFTIEDAQELVDWAIQHGIRSLAFWSVDRDHPGPEGQVSPTHRGTNDPDWAYSHVFVEFMNAFVQSTSTLAQTAAVPV